MAIPFTVDPLIMYWNRDMFFSAGIPNPPKTWDELNSLVPKLTKLSTDLRIEKSAVAMGEFSNISNASSILSALFIQAGTPIVTWGRSGLTTVLKDQLNLRVNPGIAALRFYTQFADPVRVSYSWSKARPNSRDAFLAGDLAIYFGFASESTTLAQMNPNINFGVATLPQSTTASRRSTYARMFAFAIPRTAPNPTLSFTTARALTSAQAAGHWRAMVGLPPARRDMLNLDQGVTYWSVVNDSALIALSWLQPGKATVDEIFGRMVDNVTSGRNEIESAVSQAHSELERYTGR
jgi:ABC-type glycerol-3-phosphate transport system substrate-binding protein